MIVLHLPHRVHKRVSEWMAAFAMVALGLYFMLWPSAFFRLGMGGFADISSAIGMPVQIWMWACIAFGFLRIGALILNGHRPQTSAPIRLVGSMLGAALFAGVSTALIMSIGEFAASVGLPFAIVFALAEIYNACRAGADTDRALAGGGGHGLDIHGIQRDL